MGENAVILMIDGYIDVFEDKDPKKLKMVLRLFLYPSDEVLIKAFKIAARPPN